jgi:uncharacterized membrane protein
MTPVFNIGSSEIEDGRAMAGISYLGIIGFLIAVIAGRENRYTMFHAQQSILPMVLFFVRFLPGTPFFVDSVVGLFAVVLFVIGLINGFSGKVEPLPLLGTLAYNFGLCKPE